MVEQSVEGEAFGPGRLEIVVDWQPTTISPVNLYLLRDPDDCHHEMNAGMTCTGSLAEDVGPGRPKTMTYDWPGADRYTDCCDRIPQPYFAPCNMSTEAVESLSAFAFFIPPNPQS
jgi:hypothetical protein